MLEIITGTYIPFNDNSKDKAYWTHSPNEIFSVKSSYILTKNLYKPNIISTNFLWIWNLHCPQKIKFFLWLCRLSKLPTSHYLNSIGMDLNPLCPSCNIPKTAEHIFLECKYAYIL